jgi:hypothetical protein
MVDEYSAIFQCRPSAPCRVVVPRPRGTKAGKMKTMLSHMLYQAFGSHALRGGPARLPRSLLGPIPRFTKALRSCKRKTKPPQGTRP